MNIGTRIILSFFLVVAVGLSYFYFWFVDDFEAEYRKTTEEPLIDMVRLLASIARHNLKGNQIPVELFSTSIDSLLKDKFEVQIYDLNKTSTFIRIYITDKKGIVIYDSFQGRDKGKDYSQWIDVAKTLQGLYGARTSRDHDISSSSIMYVAAPIKMDTPQGEEIIGVISLGKPTEMANNFANAASSRLMLGIIITLVAILLSSYLLSRKIIKPLKLLENYAADIRDGKQPALPALGKNEIGELGKTLEEMKITLEGKNYIERYIDNLTHELKSPIAAIKGAAEILKEQPLSEISLKFLKNIQSESTRMQDLIERLLMLASLENKNFIQKEKIILKELITKIIANYELALQQKNINLILDLEYPASLEGDSFLVQHALENIFKNALEFSPQNGEIAVTLTSQSSYDDTYTKKNHTEKSHIEKNWSKTQTESQIKNTTENQTKNQILIEVADHGPRIPEFAKAKVFERFFSLPRPDTGKKSSGLGLCLAEEVIRLHHGEISILDNGPQGTKVRVSFT